MTRLGLLIIVSLAVLLPGSATAAPGSSQLATHLKSGSTQRVVTYGTSLTALPWSTWARDIQNTLDKQYPGQVEMINSAKGGMWSTWGVENLDERVIAKKPDTVIIEFGINDAYLEYETSVEKARKNLEDMIDRILASNGGCEIILMTMNPPVDVHLARRPNIDGYYEMYRDVAAERGLLLIDLHVAWMGILESDRGLFDRYVPDGIHPGVEGCAKVIAPAVLEALGL